MTCQPGRAAGISSAAPSSTESPSTNTWFCVTGGNVVVVGGIVVVGVVGSVVVVDSASEVSAAPAAVVTIADTGAALAALVESSLPKIIVKRATTAMPTTTANARPRRRGLRARRAAGTGGDATDAHPATGAYRDQLTRRSRPSQ